MEVTLQKNLVLQELSILQGVVEHRTTIPILANILVEASEDRLRLVATDLDMTILTECAAAVHADGRLTLESKVFQSLVRNLPAEEFTLRQDGDAVEISSGRFRSRLSVADASGFPTVPEVPTGGEFDLPLELFQLLLRRVDFSITKDDPKFQLNGALVKLLPGEIEIAATDGHRLAVVRASAPDGQPPFEQQLFPRKLLTEFSRFSDEKVRISMGENHIGFLMGDRTLVSRIVDLRFPQYERVIVRDNPYRARVSRKELLDSLRRVSLMAHEKAKGVRFAFDPAGEMTLVSIGYDRGSAEETLSVSYQGESVQVSLNAAYVMDVLQVLDVETVELQLKDGNTQTVLVPVDDDSRLEEYIYVLMPMRR
ncbi:MAG: DNA polymerase III subunit beta [Thermoanaerobaculales bacterium]|nr:DNA polymerase III subunit beta [Thermoanaerobaculales bacterium]